MDTLPRVGVGVLVLKDSKVLFGKRKSKHGEGTWCPPGGKLEYGESIEDCARRETLEEANITIKNLRLGPYTNDIHEKERMHFVTPFVIADYDSGNVTVMEPEKCERWEWVDWNMLPHPLFLAVKNLIARGFSPFV